MIELKPIDHPDYRCPVDGWFHDYSHPIGDDEHLLVERCIRCSHVIRFNKCKGQIDNYRYLQTHQLWYLQPGHPFFDRYYPDAKIVRRKKKESRAEMKDRFKEQLAKGVYG